MSFADRAVAACDRAMLTGELSDRHVRDVLKCDGADVRCLYSHLLSDNSMVRMGAAKIIGKLESNTSFGCRDARKRPSCFEGNASCFGTEGRRSCLAGANG